MYCLLVYVCMYICMSLIVVSTLLSMLCFFFFFSPFCIFFLCSADDDDFQFVRRNCNTFGPRVHVLGSTYGH
jgi:hypothetical protein